MKNYHVIAKIRPRPLDHELTAANLLMNYFRADIEFLPKRNSRSADLLINGVIWEMKSPIGDGKHNSEHQFHRAAAQSKNMVFDMRRSKMNGERLFRRVLYQYRKSNTIKRLVIINKNDTVTEIESKKKPKVSS